jgi:hypothetical protein
MTGSKQVVHWTSETWCKCSEIAGSPQGYPPACKLWSRKEDLQREWIRDRRAVWDQVGLSHCRYKGLVTVRDEARLRRGHNDQSHQGPQCSETMQTGESRFHISTPPEDLNPGPVRHGVNAVWLQAIHKLVLKKKCGYEYATQFSVCGRTQ